MIAIGILIVNYQYNTNKLPINIYSVTTVDSAKGLTNGASFTLRPIL